MNENNIRKVFREHDVDKEAIRQNVFNREGQRRLERRRLRLKPMLAFGLALLLIIGGLSGFAVAAEAAEYGAAVEFFDEYRLSTEGLSRAEIKAVYKDISQKTYSYEKTIELLNNYSVEAYSEQLGSLDRENLEALWNARNSKLWGAEKAQSGVWYSAEYPDISEIDKYEIPSQRATITKHDGAAELWSYTVPYDMYVFVDENLLVTENSIIVYGKKQSNGTNSGYACAFMLDNSGELLWEYSDEGIGSEFEAAAVSDGEIALFGRGAEISGRNNRLFTLLNMDGELISKKVFNSDRYVRYDSAVRVGDCYLIRQFASGEGAAQPELISVSSDGTPLDKFTYSDGNVTYRIEDIVCSGGKVYLSALMPNITDAEFDSEFAELAGEYYDRWNSDAESNGTGEIIMSEDYYARLRKVFSERYTAVLLVCDENAKITKAYSVDNARAGTLSESTEGGTEWQVLRIDDVKNVSLFISSRSVDILATEFRLSFDGESRLVKKDEVGAYPMMY